MTRPVVVALGGNAFAASEGELSMTGQLEFAAAAMAELSPLFESDVPVVVVHGNGPQVGQMLLRVEASRGLAYELPLSVCVAETAGELGYVLQQSIHNLVEARGASRKVVSVLTQVVVDRNDPAFQRPDKPVGPVISPQRAEELRRAGASVRDDPGRGLRRVVPSPRPLAIVEAEVVASLARQGVVVIAGGGGGIPVIRHDGALRGIDAVIDKDRTAVMLADQLDAAELIFLTETPRVFLDYGTAEQRPIGRISRSEMERLQGQGHFPPGSMGPKISAALDFTARPQRQAIICDATSLVAARQGRGGTVVVSEEQA